jgi:hypothetical protein
MSLTRYPSTVTHRTEHIDHLDHMRDPLGRRQCEKFTDSGNVDSSLVVERRDGCHARIVGP